RRGRGRRRVGGGGVRDRQDSLLRGADHRRALTSPRDEEATSGRQSASDRGHMQRRCTMTFASKARTFAAGIALVGAILVPLATTTAHSPASGANAAIKRIFV